MFKPLKGRKNFVLLATGLVVIFLLSYYFFTYIPAREQQFNQRGIRAINRLDQNFQERVDHYKKSVSQFDCDYFISNLEAIEKIKGNSIYYRLFDCDSSRTGDGNNYSSNELNHKLKAATILFRNSLKNDKKSQSYSWKQRREKFQEMLKNFVKENEMDLAAFRNTLKPNASVDKLIEAFEEIDETEAIFIDSITSSWSGKAYAYLGITYENVLKRIDNGSLFETIILSEPESHRVVNHNQLELNYYRYIPSKESKVDLLQAIGVQSGDKNEDEQLLDDHDPVHIENVDITKKNISGIEYMCFTRFVQIEEKQFYLTGLVELDTYNAGVRQVSIWVVVVFILLSLFFVLILPIAKPFLISKSERMKASDLMWSAIALVFGISILSLLIIGVDTFAIEEKDLVNDKLYRHTELLDSDFQAELDRSIRASLMSSDFEAMLTNSTDNELKKDYAKLSSTFVNDMWEVTAKMRELDALRKELYSSKSKTGSTEMLKLQGKLNDDLKDLTAKESQFIDALNFEFIRISPSGRSELYNITDALDSKRLDKLTGSFNKLQSSVNNWRDTNLLFNYIEYQESLNCAPLALTIHQINRDLNLSHRMYYQLMKYKEPRNAWSFQLNDSTKTPFYLESLFSLSSGIYTTVTVTKGNRDSLRENYSYATDFQWQSVNNRYLEPGYTFAVIDKDGTIHYHSDQTKIKNQNFLEETDFNNQLLSFLHNRSHQQLGLKFSMKDHQALVSPLENTPWFVVSMYNIRKSRLNVTQSIITTFQILIMILLYMMFLHIVLQVDKTVMSHGQKHAFSYLFLSPLNVSPRVYTLLAGFNLLQIVLLIFVYSSNAINLLSNLTIFFGMITVGILVNYLVLTKFNLTEDGPNDTETNKKITGFEWVLLLLSFFWIILIGIVSNGAGYSIFMQLVLIGILITYFYLKKTSSDKKMFLTESINRSFLTKAKRGYLPFYLHSFTWIVLMGVVSTFLFFKPVYNMQHIKRGLNNWVEEFEAKNNGSFAGQPDHKINLFKSGSGDSTKVQGKLFSSASDFLDNISLYFDEDEATFKGQSASLDSITIYESIDSKSGTPYFRISSERSTHRQKLLAPRSNAVIAFDLPSIDHSEKAGLALIFWLAIILFMWLVFYFVQALGKKFFYLNLLKRLKAVSAEVDEKQATLIKLSIAGFSEKNANLMLVGPPYSERNSVAKDLIQKGQNCKYLDFFNKLDEEEKKIDVEFIQNPIIINNFDYRNLDYKLNDSKLDLLERIIRMRNEHQVAVPLIIISTFSTNQIITFYKERVKELSVKPDNKEEIDSLTSSVYRWESILYGFTTYIVKLNHQPSSNFIDNELNFGSALVYLKPQIKEFEEKLQLQRDELTDEEVEAKLIEAISDMAQNYYSAIWSACSQEEKFLLYDLAQDGLVNPKNERTLSLLVRKGLLLINPSLRIFNRSFAQFVIENISEEDGAQMERKAKKEGMWMTYKYLVLFLVLVMIVFLAFVEQEVINKMTGVITAGGILLPKIVNFISSIGNTKLFSKKAG